MAKPLVRLDLPADLVAFGQAGRQLEYDPRTCWVGQIVLVPLEQLEPALFAVSTQGAPTEEDDPHADQGGCYLVVGVNLVAACEDFDPVGTLLYLPLEKCYGVWDSTHLGIRVFPPTTTWTDIVAAPADHINAQWGDWTREETFVPWPRYPYCKRELYGPQPLPLLNDPNFLPDCVPSHTSRWDLDRVRMARLLRSAAEAMDTQATSTPEEGPVWEERATRVASAADRIAAGDRTAVGEMWDLFGFMGHLGSGDEPGGFAGVGEELFQLLYSWVEPDRN
jgi:hypothetical protein